MLWGVVVVSPLDLCWPLSVQREEILFNRVKKQIYKKNKLITLSIYDTKKNSNALRALISEPLGYLYELFLIIYITISLPKKYVLLAVIKLALKNLPKILWPTIKHVFKLALQLDDKQKFWLFNSVSSCVSGLLLSKSKSCEVTNKLKKNARGEKYFWYLHLAHSANHWGKEPFDKRTVFKQNVQISSILDCCKQMSAHLANESQRCFAILMRQVAFFCIHCYAVGLWIWNRERNLCRCVGWTPSHYVTWFFRTTSPENIWCDGELTELIEKSS